MKTMRDVQMAWKDCTACVLHETRTQVCFADGNAVDPTVLIIGEAPGPDEDKEGVPFIGYTGRFLRKNLAKAGLDVMQDCYITNSVLCFPSNGEGGFRPPTGEEVKACRPRLNEQFRIIGRSLKVVVLTGKRAIATFLEREKLESGMLDKSQGDRGWNRIVVEKYLGWYRGVLPPNFPRVYSIYHPSYITRNGGESPTNLEYVEWMRDLQAIADYAKHGTLADPRSKGRKK